MKITAFWWAMASGIFQCDICALIKFIEGLMYQRTLPPSHRRRRPPSIPNLRNTTKQHIGLLAPQQHISKICQ